MICVYYEQYTIVKYEWATIPMVIYNDRTLYFQNLAQLMQIADKAARCL